MFLTVKKKQNSAAVIWAKIVIAWCAATCVRYHSQLLTEQLWRRGETCQFQRGSSGQIYTMKAPRYCQQQLKSQRTNQPIPKHMDVVAHRALFCPLCLQPAVPLLPRRASNLPTQMLTCRDQAPSNGLHQPQFTGFNLCCHKLSKFKFHSVENAAWNHLVSFWLYMRAPKICKKK